MAQKKIHIKMNTYEKHLNNIKDKIQNAYAHKM